MKRSIVVHLLLAAALVLGGAVGCKKRVISPRTVPPGTIKLQNTPPPTGGPEQVRSLPQGNDPTAITTGGPGANGGAGNPNGRDGQTPLDGVLPTDMVPNEAFFQANTVYFDYDRSTIKESERGKIEGVAKYLEGNLTHCVRVAGHCDERGTEGYNLALGDRRALAVREYLIKLGISGSRIDTISFGESKPAVQGHSEKAYSKNRRGQFILLTPP